MANPWEEDWDTEQPATEAADVGPWSEYQDVPIGDEGYRSAAQDEVTEWDSFWHSFSQMKSFTESAGDVLEQHIPIGRIQITDPETGELDIEYQPPSEELKAAAKAGDDEWAAAIMSAEREKRLMQRFPHLYRGGELVPEAENIAGSIAGAVVDPTSLIPFIGGLKIMIATGAAFGATDGYLYSKSKTGEADPTNVALLETMKNIYYALDRNDDFMRVKKELDALEQ